jgi:uncharacterized protein involved in response to NO
MAATHDAAAAKARPPGGIPRLRPGSVAFLSYGFRPFFFGAGVWAVVAMLLWIGLMNGLWSFATQYGVVAWHAHELLLGYGAAVVTGFLLTAIPNWTGRLPVQGGGLLALFLLWMAGRIGFLASDWIGSRAAAGIDGAFLLVLAAIILREIMAGRNWRNLPVVGLVLLLGIGNALFHVEVIVSGVPDYGVRVALAAIVSMIMLIGGRITPSFTRNWLVRQRMQRLPASFGRFDQAALVISALALLTWVAAPLWIATGAILAVAAAAQAFRLFRWAGLQAWREPLVLILHLGYGFVPVGFLTVAISILRPGLIQPSDALHAWTVGAVGVMTLAVMTRATLGHTGRELTATRATRVIYLAIVAAALLRIGAGSWPSDASTILTYAAAAWIAAFGLFVLSYGPMLLTARRQS